MREIHRFRRQVARAATATLATVTLISTAAGPSAAAETDKATPPLLLAPYYTEADLTGDLRVTLEDVDLAMMWLGETSSSPHWKKVAKADTDQDGVLTVTDVADLAQRMVYDDGPFTLVEATALEMQAAMNAGVTTSVEIAKEYID
ncbi:MAG TPA: hypothetical protein VFZ72_11940, partial [Jiangellaceae bacterium]